MSSAIVAALSVRSEFVQRYQLEDFYVLIQDLAGQRSEKSTERNDEFRSFEFLGLCYRASVGIDSTRESSPALDFFSVLSGMVARACVQALMMNMFITKSLVMTPS